MSTQLRPKYSIKDYLDIEEMSNIKHEYFNGDIFAMTGASINHNRIKEDLSQTFSNQLMQQKCEVFGSDMRVKTVSGLYTYPDLIVVCGDLLVENIDGKETILNPILIVEILSKTTQGYDKTSKFELYKSIDSFQEYVLISQYQPCVTVYAKKLSGNWELETEHTSLDSNIYLSSINCTVAMSHIYRRVKFEQNKNL